MGTRRKARILAVQALYGWDMSRVPLDEVLAFSWRNGQDLDSGETDEVGGESDDAYFDFARLLITGAIQNLEAVDETIGRHLEHWEIGRVNRVDLAILRLSVYCLLFQRDIPPTVTIDEAVDISKEFCSDDSYRFINGVLDGVLKTMKRSGAESSS
jgi:transcription antitermination protein NusB